MASFLPGTTDRIHDLASELVLSLELSRGEGCDVAATAAAAERFAHAVHGVLIAAEALDQAGSTTRIDATCHALENAYAQWKSVDVAFTHTLKLAYANQVPRTNLLLDDIHATLRQRVGDPVAETYTDVRSRWAAHVAACPWDSYLNRAPQHVDRGALESALAGLARGDDLDVEDSMTALTGPLRHAFVEHVQEHADDLDDLEIGLWRRPEIMVAGDFWGHAKSARVLEVLATAGPARTRAAAATLTGFFTGQKGAATVIHALHGVHESQHERFARCLMLHPDYEVRRYAVNIVDINSIWKVVTPERVPCATILSLLEKLVGSSRHTTAQRKIFFDAVYRRLLSLTNRSDVLYARGIVRIFVKLNFFMEDDYFQKLSSLLDYLAAKERVHRIEDGVLDEYTTRIKSEKQKVGHLAGEAPSFDGIPPVVLRRLARDGHYWSSLIVHPIAKIARETVPHVSTRDRALVVANNHRVNPEVLRGLGRKRDLFSSHSARMALLANPQTPVAVSMAYTADLTPADLDALLRRSTLHPELRTQLRMKHQTARG
ncbi:MAG TPA: hypothetical protein VF247_03760 [Candidatus Krumholzibacteria bacterium]